MLSYPQPALNVPHMQDSQQQPSSAPTENQRVGQASQGQPSNSVPASRKRKTPPPSEQQPLPPPPPHLQHVLPPPHTLMQPLPPGFIYAHPPPPGDYTVGGMSPPGPPPQSQAGEASVANQSASRPLSNSKRAEQNRKAQRAFRERRDQHVKALESRSQLLDAALASADEANRRWEECRALVDQLRVENAALRAHLAQHLQSMPPPTTIPGLQPPPPQGLQQPPPAVQPAEDNQPEERGEQRTEEKK
ncbi:hypothetical protein J3R30DRAFT_3559732 [Lentinula aciculospora]|uniref:BZIP domain-containing protein n=1 Tax=Lentinula aciculospora TaxID=153920 RepID=A0A9W8ZXR4_9AGAR|nr:hypothetical protein J3R30DRAFT_3559732 [Lentinula aciculospora]